ncbi:LuxR C-terminal-related transcriptional regulator [Streptomyces lusitanus]
MCHGSIRPLDISPRTVEAHIDHILNKLGFAPRAQIAAWAAAHSSRAL